MAKPLTQDEINKIANQSFVSKENQAKFGQDKIADVDFSLSSAAAPKAKVPVRTVEDATARITNFSKALNVAVDQARKQRKDKTLDYLGGVIPTGALPATSFAGVLKAFDSSSAPLESNIVGSALDFAKDQENRIQQEAETARKNIQELALSLASGGASKDIVNAITASGDFDTALSIASDYLSKKSKNKFSLDQVGDTVYQFELDENGQVLNKKPIVTNSGSSGGTVVTTGSLKISSADISEGQQKLEQSRGADGYVDPTIYKQMYDLWVSQGGLSQDFVKQFPPKNYVNPKNTWLPPVLMPGKRDEDEEEIY